MKDWDDPLGRPTYSDQLLHETITDPADEVDDQECWPPLDGSADSYDDDDDVAAAYQPTSLPRDEKPAGRDPREIMDAFYTREKAEAAQKPPARDPRDVMDELYGQERAGSEPSPAAADPYTILDAFTDERPTGASGAPSSGNVRSSGDARSGRHPTHRGDAEPTRWAAQTPTVAPSAVAPDGENGILTAESDHPGRSETENAESERRLAEARAALEARRSLEAASRQQWLDELNEKLAARKVADLASRQRSADCRSSDPPAALPRPVRNEEGRTRTGPLAAPDISEEAERAAPRPAGSPQASEYAARQPTPEARAQRPSAKGPTAQELPTDRRWSLLLPAIAVLLVVIAVALWIRHGVARSVPPVTLGAAATAAISRAAALPTVPVTQAAATATSLPSATASSVSAVLVATSTVTPALASTATATSSGEPSPAVVLQRVANAEAALQAGSLDATIDYGGGTHVTATLLFVLGLAPRLHLTTTYVSAAGTETAEYITVGNQTWERQAKGTWAPTTLEGVWESVQPYLPQPAAVPKGTTLAGGGSTVTWFDASQNADVSIVANALTGAPEQYRLAPRGGGPVRVVHYTQWNGPVTINPPSAS